MSGGSAAASGAGDDRPPADVRPLEATEIDRVVSYFLDASPEFLDRLGVDPTRLPEREEWCAMVVNDLGRPLPERRHFYLLWEVEGVAVGHSNLNDIVIGRDARMHLHLWEPSSRRRGVGTRLVRRSVDMFCSTFDLREVYSEPSAHNPAPNRTFARAGFELVATYETTPGWINRHQLVNRWRWRCPGRPG